MPWRRNALSGLHSRRELTASNTKNERDRERERERERERVDLSPRGGGEVRTYGGGNTCHR